MAKILILGGGFGGVVAAERLARTVGRQHQITLVSREPRFVFYPALVRLAFGQSEPADVSFDLAHAGACRGEVRFHLPRDHEPGKDHRDDGQRGQQHVATVESEHGASDV